MLFIDVILLSIVMIQQNLFCLKMLNMHLYCGDVSNLFMDFLNCDECSNRFGEVCRMENNRINVTE